MFDSIYSEQLSQYYGLRRETLSESAEKHELCYLRRFDSYVSERLDSPGHITEDFINEWVGSLSEKSSSVENKIIVIRQFLEFLKHTGESVAMPSIPRVHDDYVPYIFSDTELNCIFESADNIVQKDPKADPYLVIEFPVILRLLYSCGLRIGETVKISMNDVDLDGGILRLIDTKGNKQRLVPMSAPMTDILYKYCLAMNLIGRNNIWLFPSSKNKGHISDRSVKHRFETFFVITVFKSVTERNTSVVHACIVCAMCLRLNRLQRPNGKEGTLMTLSHSCLFILDMPALMKLPSTLNSVMSCFRSPSIPLADL